MSLDGLVFYDQFGRLRPHQIALVFVGVVVLFLGVWVVSAIQPTGQGGVDVGTWVEEDEELEMATDHSPLLGGDDLFEPAEIESDPIEHPQTQTPITNHSTRFSNPSSPSSPMSPMSPTTRARIRHRGPRYGTLIPELVHPGAPTGFSIGLGAASPGFVLRPGSMSIAGEGDRRGSGAYRRVRSRSEGQPGLGTIMRSEVEEEGRRENQVERTLREWERPVETGQSREGWWRRFRKRKEGRIRLDEEGDGG